jgi:hypothetical protein
VCACVEVELSLWLDVAGIGERSMRVCDAVMTRGRHDGVERLGVGVLNDQMGQQASQGREGVCR